MFILFLILFIITLIIIFLNNSLKNKIEQFNNNNCITNEGKVGYINSTDKKCKSIEELLNASPINTQELNISPTFYYNIIETNKYCNNYSDANNNKYGLKEYIVDTTIADGSPNIKAICQKDYPKTYINNSSILETDINGNYCQTTFDDIKEDNTYGIKGFIKDNNYNTNKKVYPVCAKGYSFVPCTDKNMNFDEMCKSYSTNGNAGLQFTLSNVCKDPNQLAAVCNNNTYGMMKRLNTSVFTDCYPKNTNFQNECNKIVMADNNSIYTYDTKHNITGITDLKNVVGLKTLAKDIDSYDCQPDKMRSKCITKYDINNIGNNQRKALFTGTNIFI